MSKFVCKMHTQNIFKAFYFHERIILANIAKIKLSQIKDGLK